MYFHHFRHLGRHLEFLKMLNDDRLSSSRILNGNVVPTRIHQEKNFIPDFQVHRKYAIFVPDYIQSFKLLAFSCDCTDLNMSGMVENPDCLFSYIFDYMKNIKKFP